MPQAISHKVWFITGASKGFGYVWTEAALARGDRVAAAARNIASHDGLKEKYGDKLLPLSLDVGDKKAVDAAVEHKQFGRLDIVINNAGYGLFGAPLHLTPPFENVRACRLDRLWQLRHNTGFLEIHFRARKIGRGIIGN